MYVHAYGVYMRVVCFITILSECAFELFWFVHAFQPQRQQHAIHSATPPPPSPSPSSATSTDAYRTTSTTRIRIRVGYPQQASPAPLVGPVTSTPNKFVPHANGLHQLLAPPQRSVLYKATASSLAMATPTTSMCGGIRCAGVDATQPTTMAATSTTSGIRCRTPTTTGVS